MEPIAEGAQRSQDARAGLECHRNCGTGYLGKDAPPPFARALARAQAVLAEVGAALPRWDSLETSAQAELVRRADALAAQTAHMKRRFEHASEASTARADAFAALLAEGQQAAKGDAFTALVGEERVIAGNWHVVAIADVPRGVLSIVWLDGHGAAIANCGFTAEVDGVNVAQGAPASRHGTGGDPLGATHWFVQAWERDGVRVERRVHVYERGGAITVGGRIVNKGARAVKLGTTRLLDLRAGGWWQAGSVWEEPAAVYLGGSTAGTVPFGSRDELRAPRERHYGARGLLALVSRDPAMTLLVGCVRAEEAAPDIAAAFRPDAGGTHLAATMQFFDRELPPDTGVELNCVYITVGADTYRALETFGDAMAKFSPRPVRTGPTSLWCSWYAHRMDMTEERVLANAEVAARHLAPLGLAIMQLDHGWQRGDITGDWVPNERFPHGLPWLAAQLRERYGLRLGLWISPTDVAETSELFKLHPDWLLRGPDGAPCVNWRWYWKPNPNCYELDATHPDAYRWIVETFRRLTAEGASYYKIDFIASAGNEHFRQADPRTTRGWSALARAMDAVREGAGDAAWIRYCQTPPVLSVGRADSAYGGEDTLDAGPGTFHVLRENARILAAGYWLNDRPYHREVCDMSVRMQGALEEVRVRAAIMTLAGCSISFSDELCHLPPSRLRLMQQCLPAGCPPMRPVDLCERDIPSVWHLKPRTAVEEWDVVGLFNFNAGQEPRGVRFEELGLGGAAEYSVFEFWEGRFHGVRTGGIELVLPPESSRVLAIRKVTGLPQLIGTDMHLLQGYHEVTAVAWDTTARVLSGTYRRAAGLRGNVYFLVPEPYAPRFDFPLGPESAHLTRIDDRLWVQEVEFTGPEQSWSLPFEVRERTKAK